MDFNKRKKIKNIIFKVLFTLAAIISASMIIFILLFIIKRGVSVFLPSYNNPISLWEFLSGLTWRPDQNQYGILFILINTLISAFLAVLISFPIAVLTALYIAKMAKKAVSEFLTTVIELLAAIPSVVYGVFAVGVIVKFVDSLANLFNQTTYGGRSVLAVGILLAIMILPTMTSLSITAIKAVDKKLESASLALGASAMQTNFKVVLPAAKSGIFSGLTLGLARAFGEATAVSMVAGNRSIGPSLNPFEITRTLTSTMLSGINETVGLDYDIRYSVGIVLLLTIIISNITINYFKKKVGN